MLATMDLTMARNGTYHCLIITYHQSIVIVGSGIKAWKHSNNLRTVQFWMLFLFSSSSSSSCSSSYLVTNLKIFSGFKNKTKQNNVSNNDNDKKLF